MLDIRIFTIVIAFVSLEGQFIVSDAKDDYCYSVDKHPYLYGGTKTAYSIGDHLITNTSVPNCEPVQIWMLTRHGTRYSGKSEIKNMTNLLPKLKKKIIKNHEKHGSGHLCKEDLEGLKAWELDPNVSEDKPKYLTKQGELDLKTLGARFKQYFPQLLNLDSNDLPADKYKFRSTDTQRTVASMDYFINGLFGNVSLNNTEVVPVEQDTLLKLYKICKPWVKLMKNASTNAEVNAFIDGPEFKNVVHQVSQRLGFDEDLPFKSVLVMYTACVFERAWVVDKLSPWCAAFVEESLKVFEYEEDLHYYTHDSYGQQLSTRVGCQPLQDMFKHFTKLEKGDAKDEPQGIFYFTHSSMLQLFLTTIGAAEDSTRLTASNYEAERSRKWRTSYLAPFAANFAAVFYSLPETKMALKMNVSLLLLLVLANLAYTRDSDYCFADESDPYLYMATKTAYHFVHAGKTRFQDVPNCRAEQVWMLATHGTRCASRMEISEMLSLTEVQSQIINNHESRGNGHLCDRDLENLKRWKPDDYLVIERAEVLTPQGVEDMRLLARRLQSNFPHLLQPSARNITMDNYVFKTAEGRTSMDQFIKGLFGDTDAMLGEEVSVNDTLLSAYKTCNIWDVESNNVSMVEVSKFEEEPQFQSLMQNVSRRLGFLYPVPKRSILTMYDMCRYEKSWTVTKLSPWCAVFNKEELRVLEYHEDLYYYYQAGYGREINAQLGCTLLQDMMNHFWKVEQDKDSAEPNGVFYFSDIISLQNLLATLNINKDSSRLTAYNYDNMAKRQWRTSFISPFAANLVAVFYKCDGDSQPNKVMFYLAEKLVMLEGCDVGLCDWEYFKQRFKPIINKSNLNVCWNGNGVASYVPNIILILFSCFSLVFVRK